MVMRGNTTRERNYSIFWIRSRICSIRTLSSIAELVTSALIDLDASVFWTRD